jgi:hypothetical protein
MAKPYPINDLIPAVEGLLGTCASGEAAPSGSRPARHAH